MCIQGIISTPLTQKVTICPSTGWFVMTSLLHGWHCLNPGWAFLQFLPEVLKAKAWERSWVISLFPSEMAMALQYGIWRWWGLERCRNNVLGQLFTVGEMESMRIVDHSLDMTERTDDPNTQEIGVAGWVWAWGQSGLRRDCEMSQNHRKRFPFNPPQRIVNSSI